MVQSYLKTINGNSEIANLSTKSFQKLVGLYRFLRYNGIFIIKKIGPDHAK